MTTDHRVLAEEVEQPADKPCINIPLRHETHFFLNVNGIGHTMVTNSASSDMSSPKHTRPSALVHRDSLLIADMSSRAGLLALP